MSDEPAVDRILPPSQQRRLRARRAGHVARSAQLTAAIIILGTLLVLKFLGPGMLASWRSAAEALMSSQQLGRTSPTGMSAVVATAAWDVVGSLLPLLLAAIGLAVLASLAQVGFLVAPQPLCLRLDAISANRNLSGIFSARSLSSTAGSLLKLTAVAGVGWLAVRSELPRLVMLQTMQIDEAVAAGGAIVFAVGLKLALVLLALGLLDYGILRSRYEQDLRLTPKEAREEARRMDGDPQIRARRRQMVRQRAMAGPESRQAVH